MNQENVHLLVYTTANVEDLETGDEIVDPTILARYDGATTHEFTDVPCLAKVTGSGTGGLLEDPNPGRWCRSGNATLVYDHEYARLRCLLTLGLTRTPSSDEIAKILGTIETELFFSGWGMNLDWEVKEDDETLADLHIQVDTKPVEHRLVYPRDQSERQSP